MTLDYIGIIVSRSCTIQKKLETQLEIFLNGNKAGAFDSESWIWKTLPLIS